MDSALVVNGALCVPATIWTGVKCAGYRAIAGLAKAGYIRAYGGAVATKCVAELVASIGRYCTECYKAAIDVGVAGAC